MGLVTPCNKAQQTPQFRVSFALRPIKSMGYAKIILHNSPNLSLRSIYIMISIGYPGNVSQIHDLVRTTLYRHKIL